MQRKELLKFAKIAATTYEDPKTSRDKFKARLKGSKYTGIFDHMMDRYIAKLEKDLQ
jgi:hypothetical protein